MSISGARAISFFDDNAGSPTQNTVVQFNKLSQNGQFYHNGIGEEDITGAELYAGDESLIEIGVAESTGLDQMIAWQKAQTRLKMVLAGLQENVLWYEPSTVKVKKTFNFAVKNRNFRTLEMKLAGNEHKIWSGINILNGVAILEGYSLGWQDSDSDNKADGYVLNAGASAVSFSSDVQTINATASFNGIYLQFKWPIANNVVYLSSEITSLHPGSGLASIAIQTYNINNVKIGEIGETINSTGRKSTNYKTESNVYSLRTLVLRSDTISSPGQLACKFPALRTDDSDVYIAG